MYIFIITTCSFCPLQCPLYYFTDDHLEFDNQLVCILFPRQHSFSQSQHFLPAYNFLSWVDISSWAFLFNMSMSISVFVHFIFKPSCWWDFTDETSDIPRRYSLTINSFIFWLLQSFWPWFLSLRCRSCMEASSVRAGLHNCAFWFVVLFCNGLYLLQGEVLDEDCRLHTFASVVINI